VRGELFGVPGLELRTGVDWVRDKADQRLALTNRVWVPPMEYESIAPYAQLSWDIGPVTLSGGLRREDGELSVDDYTTTAGKMTMKGRNVSLLAKVGGPHGFERQVFLERDRRGIGVLGLVHDGRALTCRITAG